MVPVIDMDKLQYYQDAHLSRGCGRPECRYRVWHYSSLASTCGCPSTREPESFWQELETVRRATNKMYLDATHSITPRVRGVWHRCLILGLLGLEHAPVKLVFDRLQQLKDLVAELPEDRWSAPWVTQFVRRCQEEDGRNSRPLC